MLSLNIDIIEVKIINYQKFLENKLLLEGNLKVLLWNKEALIK